MAQFHFTPDDYLELMQREMPLDKQQSALGTRHSAKANSRGKSKTQAPSASLRRERLVGICKAAISTQHSAIS